MRGPGTAGYHYIDTRQSRMCFGNVGESFATGRPGKQPGLIIVGCGGIRVRKRTKNITRRGSHGGYPNASEARSLHQRIRFGTVVLLRDSTQGTKDRTE